MYISLQVVPLLLNPVTSSHVLVYVCLINLHKGRDVAKNFISRVITNYRRVAGYKNFLVAKLGGPEVCFPGEFRKSTVSDWLKVHFWHLRVHIRWCSIEQMPSNF